jgi:hypothetical protein
MLKGCLTSFKGLLKVTQIKNVRREDYSITKVSSFPEQRTYEMQNQGEGCSLNLNSGKGGKAQTLGLRAQVRAELTVRNADCVPRDMVYNLLLRRSKE